jgi:hypothetical protein
MDCIVLNIGFLNDKTVNTIGSAFNLQRITIKSNGI